MVMRASAPSYFGEGPHALWHVSEDPTITRFAPHRAATALADEPLVWAVDTRHVPLYWFPRDCPRCTFWAGPRTTSADLGRFLDGRPELRVHVIEEGWLERVRDARLYLYRLPAEPFTRDRETLGYWMSRAAVDPLELVGIDDLIGRHAPPGSSSAPFRISGPCGARSWRRRSSSAASASATRNPAQNRLRADGPGQGPSGRSRARADRPRSDRPPRRNRCWDGRRSSVHPWRRAATRVRRVPRAGTEQPHRLPA